MQRLAALEFERPFAVRDSIQAFAEIPGARRCFAFGVLGSVVLGGIAHLALLLAGQQAGAAIQPPPPSRISAVQPQPRHAIHLDMPVAVAGRAAVPFPLSVTGPGAASGTRVILHDLPEAAWFSRGTRLDEETWEVGASDLSSLELMPRDGIPKSFSMGVEVIGKDSARLAKVPVHVRLVDRPSAPLPAAGPASAPLAPVAAASPASKGHTAARDWRTSTHTKVFAAAREPAQGQAARAVPTEAHSAAGPFEAVVVPAVALAGERPEGMSGLGALPREPVPAVETRQMWWKMPLPAWAPFGNGLRP